MLAELKIRPWSLWTCRKVMHVKAATAIEKFVKGDLNNR